jgi:acetyltransferase-like isoleucine patch superfamily enzyme
MSLLRLIRDAGRRVLRAYYTARVRHRAARSGPGLRVNGRSRVTGNTWLGRNVHMNGLEVAGGGRVSIGDNFHSGSGCLFIPEIHDYDGGDALPYGSRKIPLDIAIGDNVWLGSRVIVLGGVTIGEGAIVQAGSCVVRDIPPCSVAGGHPAAVFKKRDVLHYDRLKKEGRFL